MNGYVILTFSGSDPALKQYEQFLFVTYLKSLRYGNDWFELIDADAYYKTNHRLLEALLKRPDAVLRLAVLPDDHDVAIGWTLCENNILHYAYVKANIEARRLGIAKSMVPDGIDTVTHVTKAGRQILKKRKWKFNPYL